MSPSHSSFQPHLALRGLVNSSRRLGHEHKRAETSHARLQAAAGAPLSGTRHVLWLSRALACSCCVFVATAMGPATDVRRRRGLPAPAARRKNHHQASVARPQRVTSCCGKRSSLGQRTRRGREVRPPVAARARCGCCVSCVRHLLRGKQPTGDVSPVGRAAANPSTVRLAHIARHAPSRRHFQADADVYRRLPQ